MINIVILRNLFLTISTVTVAAIAPMAELMSGNTNNQ